MATEVETLQQEVDERIQSIIDLNRATENTAAELSELNQLDANLQGDQETFKTGLEGLYTEKRHYSGKEPLVYTQTQSDVYPFYQGALDTDGNPYFRPTLVVAGSDKGIKPIFSAADRTGPVGFGRDASFAPTEDVARTAVIAPLGVYPDLTGEPLPANFPAAQGFECNGEDNPPQATQIACEADNGTWDPIPDPVWIGADTAPGIVRPLVTTWRTDAQAILDDVYLDDTATEAFWQSVVDECTTFLGLLPADAVFVRNDPNPDPTTWGQTPAASGALLTSLNALIAFAGTSVPAFATTRDATLDTLSDRDELTHFGIIGLRLHQANGSFAKIKLLEQQTDTNAELIVDHQEALDTLNRLIISKS